VNESIESSRWNDDIRRDAQRFRIIVVLGLVAAIGGMWTWGTVNSEEPTEPAAMRPRSALLQSRVSLESLGAEVEPVTPAIARAFHLKRAGGVLIVEPGSVWSRAGLRRGDVIEEVNHRAVGSSRDLEQVLKSAGDEPLLLLVQRSGSAALVAVESD
jgi:membrane-associated protease RseP (regulator of RpoE activity)